jgi:hypothetical protein
MKKGLLEEGERRKVIGERSKDREFWGFGSI